MALHSGRHFRSNETGACLGNCGSYGRHDAAARYRVSRLRSYDCVAARRRSGLTERTFKRRFTSATGLSPIAYVQRLRIEDAKRRLERTEASADEISWQVGYEEPAFFRRLFKRVTGLTPGAYRRRFKIPDYARPRAQLTS